MKPARIHSIVFRVILSVAWIALAGLSGCGSDVPDVQQGGQESVPPPAKIELTSTFADGESIPVKYTADGEDVSPPLTWSGLPAGTKELALICDDPDAPDPDNPRTEPWVHWVAYKIPANTGSLPEAIAREARPNHTGIAQGHNSWGAGQNVGYRGPAPPIGKHRYFFKLYALDIELPDEPGLDKASLLEAIKGHILAEGQLMGTYER